MNERFSDWLLKKHCEETYTNLREVWKLYIQFYTAFLTLNVLGLGYAQGITSGKKWPIAMAFIMQNVVSAGTAISVALYSKRVIEEINELVLHANSVGEQEDEALSLLARAISNSTSLPKVMKWAAYANFVTHPAFILCWIVTFYK